MSTVQIVAQVSHDILLEAIEQMAPAELEQFVSQVIALQARAFDRAIGEGGGSAS